MKKKKDPKILVGPFEIRPPRPREKNGAKKNPEEREPAEEQTSDGYGEEERKILAEIRRVGFGLVYPYFEEGLGIGVWGRFFKDLDWTATLIFMAYLASRQAYIAFPLFCLCYLAPFPSILHTGFLGYAWFIEDGLAAGLLAVTFLFRLLAFPIGLNRLYNRGSSAESVGPFDLF